MSLGSVIREREARVFRHTGATGLVVAGTIAATSLILAFFMQSRVDEFSRIEQLWCYSAALVAPATAALATMRLFAGERRNGTLPMLLSAPIDEGALVAGKFRAALSVVWLAIAASALPLAVLSRISSGSLRIDMAALIGSAIFLAVHSALLTALGTLCSVVAGRPAASACGMLIICGAVLATWETAELFFPAWREAVPFGGPGAWIMDCSLGHIPPMPLLAGLLATVCILFLATRALEVSRWR